MNDSENSGALRVAVIGGQGFFGSPIVRKLRDSGHDVTIVGRPPAGGTKSVVLDLNDASTLHVLNAFDVVVNIANGVSSPGDALLTWADRNGGCIVEASAFAPFYRRSLARPRNDSEQGAGTIILGAGVFPGWSTAIAMGAARSVESLERLDIAVRVSPLSGSGWGNAQLMARMLALPSFEWSDGVRKERPTVGRVESFPFPRGTATAAMVDLPDLELVRESTDSVDVATWMALSPGVFLHAFRFLAFLVRWSGPFRRPFLAVLHWQLAFWRGLVFRDRTSSVEVVVRATGAASVVERSHLFPDGILATASGVVRAVEVSRTLSPGRYVAGAHTGLPGD